MKKLRLLKAVIFAVIFVFALTGCDDDSSGGTDSTDNTPEIPTEDWDRIPDTPTNIVVSAQSSTSIIISWPKVSGALQYYVYKSEESSGTYTRNGVTVPTDTGVCSFTATGLLPYTTYYFMVSSCNSGGESSRSSYVTATTNIAVPTDLIAKVLSTSSITISWTKVSGATGYYVYKSESANGTYTYLDEKNTESYTATGLLSDTTYYFKVSSYNGAGETSLSSFVYATTLLPTPTNVTAIAGANRSITISWSAVTGAIGYRVYYSTSADGTYTLLAAPSATQYTGSSFAPDTTYYFKVSAYSSSGESEQSSSVFAVAYN